MPRRTQVTQTPWAAQGSCHETLSSMSVVCLLYDLPLCPSFGGADPFPKINPSGLLPLKEDFSSCLSIPATAALPLRALVTALASHSSSAQQQVTAEILLPPQIPLPCAAWEGQEWCGLQPPLQGLSAPPDPVKLPHHPQAQLVALAGGARAARATRAEAALRCKSQTPSAPYTGKGLKPLQATAAPLINETRERLRTKRMAQHINPSLMQGL